MMICLCGHFFLKVNTPISSSVFMLKGKVGQITSGYTTMLTLKRCANYPKSDDLVQCKNLRHIFLGL